MVPEGLMEGVMAGHNKCYLIMEGVMAGHNTCYLIMEGVMAGHNTYPVKMTIIGLSLSIYTTDNT
jgi:hypothetical protein